MTDCYFFIMEAEVTVASITDRGQVHSESLINTHYHVDRF